MTLVSWVVLGEWHVVAEEGRWATEWFCDPDTGLVLHVLRDRGVVRVGGGSVYDPNEITPFGWTPEEAMAAWDWVFAWLRGGSEHEGSERR